MTAKQTGTQARGMILAAAIGLVLLLAGCVDPQPTDGAVANTADTSDADASGAMTDPEDDEAPALGPIHMEMLTTRAVFTDAVAAEISLTFEGRDTTTFEVADLSRTAVAKVTLQPGAVFPWHTHPGPVILNFVEGRFVYIFADDCVHREYQAGEALIDAGGDNVHTARNPSETDVTVVLVTFLGAPADPDAPLTVPVDAETQGVLNEQCEL